MHGSMGAFSLEIGKSDRRLIGADGGGATSFGQVFINHPGLTINSAQCATGFTGYTPGSTDERTISVSFSDAGREIRVVDLPVKSVPFAMQAEQISGYSVNSLFKIAGTAQPGDKPSSLFARDAVDLLWEIAHNQDFLGKSLKNLGEPTVASDAATKNYVDSLISQGSLGVITNVIGDANILAGTVGTTRALSLGTTGVTAGVYGAVGPSGGSTGVSVPVLTVDMWGRITSASQEPLPLATTGGGFGLITVDASSGLTLNSGTLGLNLSSLSGANFGAQAQNVVLAGPLSGGTGAVSFRVLDEADIPQLASTGKVQNSATSATPALTNDAIIARDAVGGFKASGAFLNYLALDNGLQAGTSSAILLSAPAAASYSLVFPGAAPQNGDLLSFNSSGQMSWVQPGAAGLTSLALSVPAAEMNVSSPVGPGDGTLSLSWKNQNAGLVFAAPTGASGQPSFRSLAASDIATGTLGSAQIPDLDATKVTSGTFDLVRIPDFSAAKITSGTLPVSRGGTGLVPQVSDADRLYGINAAGTNSEFKTLVAGSGISISNMAGSINISAPGSGTLGWAQGGNSFAQTGTLGTNDNQALTLQTNGSTRMAITTGGSVGFGTSAPVSLLSNSSTGFTDSSSSGINSSGLLWASNGGNGVGYTAIFSNPDSTPGGRHGLLAQTAATGSTSYIARFESGGVNRVSIRSDGNVGIGTTTPLSPLTVNGEIRLYPPGLTTNSTTLTASANGYVTTDNDRGIRSGNGSFLGSGSPGTGYLNIATYTAALNVLPTGNTGRNLFELTGSGFYPNIAGYVSNLLYFPTTVNSTATTTVRGLNTTITDNSSSVANTIVGVYSDVSAGTNASANRYSGIFMGGNVGIGTTDPSAPLHVIETSGAGDAAIFEDNSSSGASTSIAIRSGGSGSSLLKFQGGTTTYADIILPTSANHLRFRADTFSYTTLTNAQPYAYLDLAGDGGRLRLQERAGPTTKISLNATGNSYIDSGNVGIGKTNPNYKLDVTGDISASGCLRSSDGVASGTCVSDERLKTDVRPFDLGLDALLGIKPRFFRYNGLGEHPASTEPELGVIAQEVERTAPQLIKTKTVKLNPADSQTTKLKQVNYTAFTYVLINAVKDLYHRWSEDSQALRHDITSVRAEVDQVKANSAAKDQRIRTLEQENLTIKAYLCAKDRNADFCR